MWTISKRSVEEYGDSIKEGKFILSKHKGDTLTFANFGFLMQAPRNLRGIEFVTDINQKDFL